MCILRWHDFKADLKAVSHVPFGDNYIPECVATSLVENVSKTDMQTINMNILMLDIIFLNRTFNNINVTIIKQYIDCSCSIEKSNTNYIMQVDTTLLRLNSSADTHTQNVILHTLLAVSARIYTQTLLELTPTTNCTIFHIKIVKSDKKKDFTQYLSAVVSVSKQCWLALCCLCDVKCFK